MTKMEKEVVSDSKCDAHSCCGEEPINQEEQVLMEVCTKEADGNLGAGNTDIEEHSKENEIKEVVGEKVYDGTDMCDTSLTQSSPEDTAEENLTEMPNEVQKTPPGHVAPVGAVWCSLVDYSSDSEAGADEEENQGENTASVQNILPLVKVKVEDISDDDPHIESGPVSSNVLKSPEITLEEQSDSKTHSGNCNTGSVTPIHIPQLQETRVTPPLVHENSDCLNVHKLSDVQSVSDVQVVTEMQEEDSPGMEKEAFEEPTFITPNNLTNTSCGISDDGQSTSHTVQKDIAATTESDIHNHNNEVFYLLLDKNGSVTVPDTDISHLMEYRNEATDADSERSDTSCSSSSIDESSSDEEILQEFSGGSSEEEGQHPQQKFSKKRTKKEIPRTKGEYTVHDLPLIEDLAITVDENVVMVEVGKILNIVDALVIVQAKNDLPALNMDTILFLDDRKVLGQIFETFGPVSVPLYSVRYNSNSQIEEKGITTEQTVYYAPGAPEFTHYVFMEHLKQLKGSDASWEHNNEPPAQFLDYSDDEQEKKAKSDRAKERQRERERNGLEPKGKKTNNKKNMDSRRGGKNIDVWPPENHSQFPNRPSMGIEVNTMGTHPRHNRWPNGPGYGQRSSLHTSHQDDNRESSSGYWNRTPSWPQQRPSHFSSGSVGPPEHFGDRGNPRNQGPPEGHFPSWPPNSNQNKDRQFRQSFPSSHTPFQPQAQQSGNRGNCLGPTNFGQNHWRNRGSTTNSQNSPVTSWGQSNPCGLGKINQRAVFGQHNMQPPTATNQRPDHTATSSIVDTRYVQCQPGHNTNNRPSHSCPPRCPPGTGSANQGYARGQFHNSHEPHEDFGSFSKPPARGIPMQHHMKSIGHVQQNFIHPQIDCSVPPPNMAPVGGAPPPNNNVHTSFGGVLPPHDQRAPHGPLPHNNSASINNSPLALYPTSNWGHVG